MRSPFSIKTVSNRQSLECYALVEMNPGDRKMLGLECEAQYELLSDVIALLMASHENKYWYGLELHRKALQWEVSNDQNCSFSNLISVPEFGSYFGPEVQSYCQNLELSFSGQS